MRKIIQATSMAFLLTVALSTVAMAGNIAGLRATAEESETRQVSASGNIGGLKADASGDTTAAVVGNIGGLLRVVFSTATIW